MNLLHHSMQVCELLWATPSLLGLPAQTVIDPGGGRGGLSWGMSSSPFVGATYDRSNQPASEVAHKMTDGSGERPLTLHHLAACERGMSEKGSVDTLGQSDVFNGQAANI
jgi:hypothetical protein